MKKLMGLLFLCTLLLLVNSLSNNQNGQSIDDQKINNVFQKSVKKDKYKIVIDAGHGGKDSGATGASGSYEKDFTLKLAEKVTSLLEKDPLLDVYMTREEDVFLSAETRERPNYANNLEADLYISIHANTFSDSSVSGTETYYYDSHSKSLANIMHKHVQGATNFNDRGVRREDYFVLKDTNMPAVLLEIGYMTNPQEEQKMLTDDFQQAVAESIHDGIKEYLLN